MKVEYVTLTTFELDHWKGSDDIELVELKRYMHLLSQI